MDFGAFFHLQSPYSFHSSGSPRSCMYCVRYSSHWSQRELLPAMASNSARSDAGQRKHPILSRPRVYHTLKGSFLEKMYSHTCMAHQFWMGDAPICPGVQGLVQTLGLAFLASDSYFLWPMNDSTPSGKFFVIAPTVGPSLLVLQHHL